MESTMQFVKAKQSRVQSLEILEACRRLTSNFGNTGLLTLVQEHCYALQDDAAPRLNVSELPAVGVRDILHAHGSIRSLFNMPTLSSESILMRCSPTKFREAARVGQRESYL